MRLPFPRSRYLKTLIIASLPGLLGFSGTDLIEIIELLEANFIFAVPYPVSSEFKEAKVFPLSFSRIVDHSL